MNWKDWLFPWRAKAKIEELQACLNRSVDAAPFTAKINLLEDRLEQSHKALKAALDEKHACATLLSSTRASEQDWRETASKVDLEKNELASLNRTLVDQLEHAKANVEEWKGRVKVERKEREDVEKAIGGMKAEVVEAQTLAAKASKLQEALDHEIAEHRLAKEQVLGLTKWIRVAHRLDSPSPKGTIRRILQSARFRGTSRSGTVTAMALLCFAWTALGQAPFWRNPWSTNQAPPVIGTNLWVSNTAQGQGWLFYNYPSSNSVARMRDITNTFSALYAFQGNTLGVVVGDSRSAAWTGATWPFWFTNFTGTRFFTNAAVGGYTVSNMWVDYPSAVTPYAPTTTGTNAVLIFWGSIGDNISGLPLQSCVTNISNILFTAKSQGYTVVACTEPDAPTIQTPAMQSYRYQINQYISTNQFCDYVVPLDAVFPLWLNTTNSWLNDGSSHFTTNSSRMVGSEIARTLSVKPRCFPGRTPSGYFGQWNVGLIAPLTMVSSNLITSNLSVYAAIDGTAVNAIFRGTSPSNSQVRLQHAAVSDRAMTISGNGIQCTLASAATVANMSIQSSGGNTVFGSGNVTIGGSIGIGTNSPQSAAHIQGTQSELLRVDTIAGGTGALTVSSNPVVRIRTQMYTNQPIGCYGSMMFNNTNYGQAFGITAYTNVVGYNVWLTNQFVVNTNTGYITNIFAGIYRVTTTISFVGENGKTYEGCLLTNNVDPETIAWHATFDNPARYRTHSASGMIYLPALTGCSFAMKETDGQSAIQIFRGSVTIGTP